MSRAPSPDRTQHSASPDSEDELDTAVDDIVFAALELETGERNGFLDGLRDVSPEVLAQARHDLNAIARMPDSFLAETGASDEIVEATARGPEEPAPMPVGQRIGRFTLIERVGVGAMGAVYSAYDEELDRKVAVKLVKPDADRGDRTGDTSARLLREARTLARISHPNVVQIYEAGRFQNLVYLAMEFVRGVTLAQWLDPSASDGGGPDADRPDADGRRASARSWREILAVFIPAARGLLAAHRAGLVHRDFKPANVLVGDDGQVRVVDFGLARNQTLGQDVTEPDQHAVAVASDTTGADERMSSVNAPASLARLTRTGSILGTPVYMSPEQWQDQDIDARSDQFSFFVALYEALYGQRPFATRSIFELAPATIGGSFQPPPKDTAVPRRLWTLIERGLAPDPDDRYPSMQEIIDALSWDPGQRRRRLIGGLTLVLAVVASVAVTAELSSTDPDDPCANTVQDVEALWGPDTRQAIERGFLDSGLRYAPDTWRRVSSRLDEYTASLARQRQAACVATHVRHQQSEEVLELRNLCLDRGRDKLKALLGHLAQPDDSMIEHSVRAVSALPAPERCADREALLLGVRPPDEAAVATRVTEIRAQLNQGDVHYQSRALDRAAAVIEPLLENARTLGYAPVRAEVALLLGMVYRQRARGDDVERALELLLEAVDHAERSRHDEVASRAWSALTRLAAKHHSDRTRGYRWSRRALVAIERSGSNAGLLAEELGWRGTLHSKDEQLEEAEELVRRGLRLAEAEAAQVDALVEVQLWNLLGNVMWRGGRDQESGVAYETALRIARDNLGESHPRIVVLEYNLALFLVNKGDYGRARELWQRVLDNTVGLYGDYHVEVGDVLMQAARLERLDGDLEQAQRYGQRAHDVYERVLSPDDRRLGRLYSALGFIDRERGALEPALAWFQKSLDVRARALGEDDIRTAMSHGNVAWMLLQLGRHGHAWPHIDRLERGLEPDGVAHPRLSWVPIRLRGLAHFEARDHERAIPLLERAIELLEEQPSESLNRAEAQWALARALHASGRGPPTVIRQLAERARDIHSARGRAGERSRDAIEGWLTGLPGAEPGVEPRP